MNLSFQVHVNSDTKYLISNVQTKKAFNTAPKIQFNHESLSFDLVFSKDCPTLKVISEIKILAVAKSQ